MKWLCPLHCYSLSLWKLETNKVYMQRKVKKSWWLRENMDAEVMEVWKHYARKY